MHCNHQYRAKARRYPGLICDDFHVNPNARIQPLDKLHLSASECNCSLPTLFLACAFRSALTFAFCVLPFDLFFRALPPAHYLLPTAYCLLACDFPEVADYSSRPAPVAWLPTAYR
jgi:hypothetical protein